MFAAASVGAQQAEEKKTKTEEGTRSDNVCPSQPVKTELVREGNEASTGEVAGNDNKKQNISPKKEQGASNLNSSINRENSFSNVVLGDGGMVRGMSAVMEMGGFGLSDLPSLQTSCASGTGNGSSSNAVWGGVDGFPGGASQNGSSASLNTNVERASTVVGILDPPAPTTTSSNTDNSQSSESVNNSSAQSCAPVGMPLSMIHGGAPVFAAPLPAAIATTPIPNSSSIGNLITAAPPTHQPILQPYYFIPRPTDGSMFHAPFSGATFQPHLFAMQPPPQFVTSGTPSAMGSSNDLPQQQQQQSIHDDKQNLQLPSTTTNAATITPDASQYAIYAGLQQPHQLQQPWIAQLTVQQQQMQLQLQQQQQAAAAAGYYFMHPQMFQPHPMMPQVIAAAATTVAPAVTMPITTVVASPNSIPKRGGNNSSRRAGKSSTSPVKRKRGKTSGDHSDAPESGGGMVMSMVDAAGRLVYVDDNQSDTKWQRNPQQLDYFNNNNGNNQHQLYYNYYQNHHQDPNQQSSQQQQQQQQDSDPESDHQASNNNRGSSSSDTIDHHSYQQESSSKSSVPRRYLCSLCSKRFTRPSTLRTHMNSHTGERPFVCTAPGCGWKFTVLSNLKRHLKICPSVQQAGGPSAAADVLNNQQGMRGNNEDEMEEEGEGGGGCVGVVEGQW
ncbi:UNVERIFIED_CONTAM: hypothetical protein HDU68_010216 [Siphonaria sp. JEL0065]|nr:hypothetical protein HDU68_010216 [Siphonaria sp. JEL0065]